MKKQKKFCSHCRGTGQLIDIAKTLEKWKGRFTKGPVVIKPCNYCQEEL